MAGEQVPPSSPVLVEAEHVAAGEGSFRHQGEADLLERLATRERRRSPGGNRTGRSARMCVSGGVNGSQREALTQRLT